MALFDSLPQENKFEATLALYHKQMASAVHLLSALESLNPDDIEPSKIANWYIHVRDLGIITDETLLSKIEALAPKFEAISLFLLYNDLHNKQVLDNTQFLIKIGFSG